MPSERPVYSDPPITELKYSLQFEPMPGLHMGYLGSLWEQFKPEFPRVDHAEEMNHEIERFGSKWRPKGQPQFKVLENAPAPRIIMVSERGDRRLHLQKDRLVYDWIGSGEGKYPGFNSLGEECSRYLDQFESFVENCKQLGRVRYNQAEVTKINQVPVEGWDLADVIEGLNFKRDIFPEQKLETCSLQMSHQILVEGEPVGRLYSRVGREVRLSDGEPVYVLYFTGRANLKDDSRESALEALELLGKRINSAFESLTTKKAKSNWGKKEI